ncbi:MAG: hypothetical protein Q4G11_07400, partial [Gallicola sp.]|nr:hypothetical protein [Gallicola sp.]
KTPAIEAIFTFDELGGSVSGMSFGDNAICIYSRESYLIVDFEWNIIFRHLIDNPDIKDDSSFINQTIYRNGVFYLLIFDHSIRKSYIIAQPEADQPQYGELICKEIRSFDVIEKDFLLAGLDERLLPWIARTTSCGKVVWENRQGIKNFIPSYCTFYDEKVYTISSNPYETAFCITMLKPTGQELAKKEFKLSDSPLRTNSSRFDVFCVNTSLQGIALFGQQMSNDNCLGVFVLLDNELHVIANKVYENYSRIQSAVRNNNQYRLLALPNTRLGLDKRKYIIDESGVALLALESQDSSINSIGLVSDMVANHYLFGLLYSADRPTSPSVFISRITLK